MSTEFIIGTILGIIGCISSFISFFKWMKKPNLSKLFNRLVDKNLPQERRKKVLQRIDKRLRLAGRRGLKSAYIANFTLGKRGKEAVFEDLCLQNRLEPTPELCKMFLTVDSAVIRNRYYAQTSTASSTPATPATPGTPAPAASTVSATFATPAASATPAILEPHAAPAALDTPAAPAPSEPSVPPTTPGAPSPAGRNIPAALATAAVLAASSAAAAPVAPVVPSASDAAASSVAASAAGQSDTAQPAGKHPVVCLSALLAERFPDACRRLTDILDRHGVPYRFLQGTRDIWCRDYMPVRTASGRLVQFRYEPSYLKGNPAWEQSRTDPAEVCRLNGITPDTLSAINLDGGNVLLCGGRAVISDRVFSENPHRDRDDLLAELARLLEAEIIIIPSLRDDMTGHADGMVRFIDPRTLLGNDRAAEYKYWTQALSKTLSRHALAYEDIPFFCGYKDATHPDHAIGVYVNYLEVGNLMIVPLFGVPGNKDAEALARLRALFPDRTIETIDYNDIALQGGLLNCTTWLLW